MKSIAAANRYFRLPLWFDPIRLQADLAICEEQDWKAHYNTNDYRGDWSGISLRSATGSEGDINTIAPDSFADTALLLNCPYFRKILEQFPCTLESVRLLALSPGSVIKEHRDPGLGYEHGRFRLHLPIRTDPDVLFIVDNDLLHMEAGQCWYANFSLPHRVEHHGSSRRIHLVIDGIRNDWTDDLFARAGYDFAAEAKGKEYDSTTKAAMIRQLRLMDSPAARSLLLTLESTLVNERNMLIPEEDVPDVKADKNWIPVGVEKDIHGYRVKWLHAGDAPFTEPFFHQTIARIKRLETNRRYPNVTTPLNSIIEKARHIQTLQPAAIIFHTSRCGSTLLSQMLSTGDHHLVLSEVPLLDAWLRLPFKDPSLPTEISEAVFEATVQLLAHCRNNEGGRLIIKTDSWHVFFHAILRRLYPDTPFILMYRRPDEILASHQRQRGLQSIPGYLEPSFTGLHLDPGSYADLDGYLIRWLESVFQRLIEIKTKDPDSWLIPYHAGPEQMLRVLERAMRWSINDDDRQRMMARSHFHAKKSNEVFTPDAEMNTIHPALETLFKLYHQLEKMQS